MSTCSCLDCVEAREEAQPMTPEAISWLRKGVEWVEGQAALPEIDREWLQSHYILPAFQRAIFMVENDVNGRDHVQQVAAHCGTAYCVAGYLGMCMDERYQSSDQVNGIHVSEFVKEQLGMTSYQADRLFDGDNTAKMVRAIAEDIAGEAL